jgi:PadR family transcriptional regulator PadR
MFNNKVSSDLLRGNSDTMILKLLLSGDKYKYKISKMIRSNSNNEYELKESTMFSSLKRMENDGNVTSYWGDETQGGRRTYIENKKNWEYAKLILDHYTCFLYFAL